MSYDKRYSGRKFDEMRPIEAKIGVIKRADGSALFKIALKIITKRFSQNMNQIYMSVCTLNIHINIICFN